jgi:flagellar basal-body rod modification protein FlgD
MQMLIAQMQNQDPMNPMDNAEMTAQLAQFSSLEQMQQLNSQFSLFQQSTTSALSMMTAGKPVELELSDGSTVKGLLEKVQWYDNETQFVINGTAYSAGAVRSLRAGAADPEVTANESGV